MGSGEVGRKCGVCSYNRHGQKQHRVLGLAVYPTTPHYIHTDTSHLGVAATYPAVRQRPWTTPPTQLTPSHHLGRSRHRCCPPHRCCCRWVSSRAGGRAAAPGDVGWRQTSCEGDFVLGISSVKGEQGLEAVTTVQLHENGLRLKCRKAMSRRPTADKLRLTKRSSTLPQAGVCLPGELMYRLVLVRYKPPVVQIPQPRGEHADAPDAHAGGSHVPAQSSSSSSNSSRAPVTFLILPTASVAAAAIRSRIAGHAALSCRSRGKRR